MSLINQMLQDLDARRSDISGGASFGQQIRAVPERRHIHPAWWVALALAVMLVGVVGYLVLRPSAPAPQVPGALLPLKIDTGLTAVEAPHGRPAPAAEPAQLPVAEAPAATTQPAPEPAAAKPVQVPVPGIAADRIPDAPKAAPAPSSAKEPNPPAKALAPAAAARALEQVIPPAINKQVRELTPAQRAENEYRKAVLALQQGKRSEAANGLEQTLAADPKHAGARQALIGLLLDEGQQDAAMQKAREGLASDPAQTGLAMILARLQLEKGELRPAVDTLERTLPHAADKPEYLAFLAALLQRDERHKQAAEHYLQALQKAPQNGVWWMGLGISQQADRRHAEAQESFKRAKATNSLSPELLAFVEARIRQLQQ